MWAMISAALLIICVTRWVYSWYNPKCNGNGILPPGSMGLPLIGESFDFFAPNTSSDVPPFIKTRVEKYGSIFKTSLVTRPVIITTDVELSQLIFQHEGTLFQSWYLDTFTQVFGRQNVSTLHGFLHKYVKNMMLSIFGPESLKKLIPDIDREVRRKLSDWCSNGSVEMKKATESLMFDLAAKKLISYDSGNSTEDLKESFASFMRGLISFPLNIPGTAFNKCLKGRKKAIKMLKVLLQKRRESPRKEQDDFFDYVLTELQKEGTLLTEEMALDMMFVLLFASYETVSSATTLAIKFLSDHPSVLQALKEEHERILRNRENPDSEVSWQEYKTMKFTRQVINETVRLANIVPVIVRKALKDVQFKGYTIPAGWAIMVSPPAVHLNPDKYEDPLAFNPWRWDGVDLNGGTKSFMAFGGGVRFCVGTEYTKVQMAVVLHHLVTKYTFKTIKGGDIVRIPGLQFPNGLHIQLTEKESLPTYTNN